MEQQLLNFAESTLDGGINNSQTTIDVQTGEGTLFGSVGELRVVVEDEVMIMTSISADTLTVLRGQEGTTAVAHASGTDIKANWTAGLARQLFGDYNKVDVIANRPTGRVGQRFHPTDAPFEYIHDGTNWLTQMGGILLPYGPVDGAAATQVNFTGATVTNQGDTCHLTIPVHATNYRNLAFPIGVTTGFTVQAAIEMGSGPNRNSTFKYIGVRDSTNDYQFVFGIVASDSNRQLIAQYNTNSTTGGGQIINNTFTAPTGILVVRIVESSGSLQFWVSWDGVNFQMMGTFVIATYYVAYTPGDLDEIIIGGYNTGDYVMPINFGGLLGM